jgi:hypothetical protein
MSGTFEFEPGMDTIETKIQVAIGAASMCWEDPAGAGVFDSERAAEIAGKLLAEVRRYILSEPESDAEFRRRHMLDDVDDSSRPIPADLLRADPDLMGSPEGDRKGLAELQAAARAKGLKP